MTGYIMPRKSLVRIAIAVALILLVPLVLTLLNPHAGIYNGGGGGWDWSPGDFVIMGALLFCTGLAIDFAIRTLRTPSARIIAVSAITFLLFLIWIELAVDGVSQLVQYLISLT